MSLTPAAVIFPAVRFVLFTLYALGAACAPPADRAENQYARLYGGQPLREVAHPNGLFVRLPASLSVAETADGFEVTPPPVRSLSPVVIRLHPGAARPETSGAEGRVVGGRRLSSRVTEEGGGGSGGAEYALTVWEECRGGYISYHQIEQAETGRPAHEFAWYVIGQAGFRRGGEGR